MRKELKDFIEEKYGDDNPYQLNFWNIDKIIPKDYDDKIIPEIERITKDIKSMILKEKIYNYIISYYNWGVLDGILKTIHIASAGGDKRIAYQIEDSKIILELALESDLEPAINEPTNAVGGEVNKNGRRTDNKRR